MYADRFTHDAVVEANGVRALQLRDPLGADAEAAMRAAEGRSLESEADLPFGAGQDQSE
jgi:hypothetical protein